MKSPQLLLLVENCPKGAETLVTRCLHILTDKGKVYFTPLPSLFADGLCAWQKGDETGMSASTWTLVFP